MLRRGRWGTGSYPCLKPALTFAHVTDDPGRVLQFILLPGVRPALRGREALRPPYYSPHCVHTQHTPPPALLCSHRRLCAPGPRGQEPGVGVVVVSTLPVGAG